MKKVIYFFCLAYLGTWVFWGISLLDALDVVQLPFAREILGTVGTFAPSIVGLIFLIRFKGREFKSIVKETFLVKGNPKTLFITFLLMPSILGGSYLVSRFLFNLSFDLQWFETPSVIPIVYIYILFLGGPLGEEIGWRGFALPELLKHYSPFIASIILGIVWTCWHIPAFFIPGSAQAGISFILYIINTLMLTVIITVLYLRTKRISNAVYFHASSNFALGIFYIIDETISLVLIGFCMVLTLSILLYKERQIFFKKITEAVGE